MARSSRLARRKLDAATLARHKRRLRARPTSPSVGPLIKPSPRLAVHDVESVPDLLCPDPQLTVDAGELCGAMDFAFAGGGCYDTLYAALEGSPPNPTDFSPDDYVDSLFLAELVNSCMSVRVKGWDAPVNEAVLIKVLAHPPSDPAVADFRRDILAELSADDSLRSRFEELYRQLCRLRRYFDHDGTVSSYEATRRRIDTLSMVRDVVELASEHFAEATSGLERIHQLASEIQSSEGWSRLVELLDYENDMAKVDVRMQVGADGRVRQFSIVKFEENEDNSFYAAPFSRFITRVVMFWRGYRLDGAEMVSRWLDLVFQGISHFLPAMMQLLGHMEIHLAQLGFADLCRSKGLEVCFAELSDDGGRHVEGLFNPILFRQGVTPQTCELHEDKADAITVITGPNSGGKTRLLQAVGLTQLLAQNGFFVPAKRASFRRASGMFVSLIDEQRADQKEGRLGTELMRIRRLFETSRGGALVILDELCSGTNPSEGEEIFYLVLTLLQELAPEAFITTHFLEFARRLASDDEPLPVRFLQVELDEDQHPTYGFVPGVATTSLATQTAARLGVTREELLALVRRNKR
jgi:MutS domain V